MPWFEVSDENDFKLRVLLTPGNESVCVEQFKATPSHLHSKYFLLHIYYASIMFSLLSDVCLSPS